MTVGKYIYIYTWNPNDDSIFEGQSPQKADIPIKTRVKYLNLDPPRAPSSIQAPKIQEHCKMGPRKTVI